jgi:hypothetical protein
LRRWEAAYNHHRPHQALGYRTPAEFLADLSTSQVWRTYRTRIAALHNDGTEAESDDSLARNKRGCVRAVPRQ